MCDVSISLVSYHQRHDLEGLLPTLLPAAARVDAEILLVDNRGTDGTSDYVAAHFPTVNILRNDERAGYGENHNVNLQRARGRYFVIMNSDMLVEDQRLFSDLLAYMERHQELGIVCPKVLNEDGTVQGLNKRYPTLWDLFIRRFVPAPMDQLFERRKAYYEMRDLGYDREYDVPFISGAFMFCRTDILKRIGGFDPRYFLYFEDVDLCRRVQQTHRTAYYPWVSVIHKWERAAHSSPAHRRYFLESARRYFGKWGYKVA